MAMKYNRRRFMKTVAAGVGGAFLLPARGADLVAWRFFTGDEARLVDAITEQIIPQIIKKADIISEVKNVILKRYVKVLHTIVFLQPLRGFLRKFE